MLNWIGKVTFVDFTYPHCLTPNGYPLGILWWIIIISNIKSKTWQWMAFYSFRIHEYYTLVICYQPPELRKRNRKYNPTMQISSPLWLATNGYPVSAIRICEICSRYGFGILINICRKNITAWCYLNVAKQNIWCAWESHRKQYRHRISGKSPLCPKTLLCNRIDNDLS